MARLFPQKLGVWIRRGLWICRSLCIIDDDLTNMMACIHTYYYRVMIFQSSSRVTLNIQESPDTIDLVIKFAILPAKMYR